MRTWSGPLWLLVGLALAGFVAYAFGERVGGEVEIRIDTPVEPIGPSGEVTIEVSEPTRGLLELQVVLVQRGWQRTLVERTYPPPSAWSLEAGVTRDRLSVSVGTEHLEGLVDGEATVRVVAARASTWRHAPPPSVAERALTLVVEPPRLTVHTPDVRAIQGGVGVVVYSVDGRAVRHGVRVGDAWFPGATIPGEPPAGRRFAMFAAPYDVAAPEFRLVAADAFGRESSVPLLVAFTPRAPTEDTIDVDEPLLARMVPRVVAGLPAFQGRGGLVETYVALNGELRTQNAARLTALAAESAQRFLFRRRFVPMDGRVFGTFADRRTYRFAGRVIDQQVHLGIDLASVGRAPIPAANDGVVRLAEPLGIYGNAVVVDHGFGLMSLYAHLDRLEVRVGEVVTRGHVLGRSGTTGLALGDHLHFTMLLHGHAVDPLEWFDGRFVEAQLGRRLGPAFGFRPD